MNINNAMQLKLNVDNFFKGFFKLRSDIKFVFSPFLQIKGVFLCFGLAL